MTSQVPGVEESVAPSLHQQRVGVEAAVVGEVRGHGEGADRDRDPVDQVAGRVQRRACGAEERGCIE